MRLIRFLVPLLLAPLPAMALAQAPAPGRTISYPGVSAAGNAILTKLNGQADPAFQQLLRQQRSTREQLANAIMVSSIDTDRVATLMKQLDQTQAQIRARSSDRVLTALRALSEVDRGPFLRAIAPTVNRPAN